MKTISNNIEEEIIINKSRFICKLFIINSVKEANDIIKKNKEIYKDANHNCYAYIVENIKKSSDDKEPSGTAGLPILNGLESNNLSNVLCIVIRYFGGVKLGTGGLIRAYTKSVTTALKLVNIKELIKYNVVSITFNHNNTKNIDYILKDSIIINKSFENIVTYKILVKVDDEFIINNLNSFIINYNIEEIIYM